jgi:uncharacterized protein (DUF1810 family)
MTTDDDAYDLARFVSAQDAGGTYGRAVGELQRGHKVTHWMWYVFPQVAGLGRSEMARRFAVSGLEEARAYLAHPVLGDRLRASTGALLDLPGSDPAKVLGPVDAVKLRSSMTLFLRAAPDEVLFQQVLDRYFDGAPDEATVRLLQSR